jgi:hypothetical protein
MLHGIFHKYLRIMLAAIALAANSCAWLPRPLIADGIRQPLPIQGVFADNLAVTQSVILAGRGKEQKFLLQTEVTPHSLIMVAMTGFGQKLFELIYIRNELIIHNTPFLPERGLAEALFTDFQLIYWPAEPLQSRLAESSITLREPGETQRIFHKADKIILEILYNPGRGIEHDVAYRNFEKNYSLQIDTLSAVHR